MTDHQIFGAHSVPGPGPAAGSAGYPDAGQGASSATGIALETFGLGLRYRRGWALRDCSLRVPAGRVCALVGANGAGKTTLLSITANLLAPTEGHAAVFGSPSHAPQAQQAVGFLAQEKPLYTRLTVREHLRLGRELNPCWDADGAERIVCEGGIPLGARAGTLSGGQRTRVALALAFGKRPGLLLLDEPMSDLDPLVRHEVMGLIMAEVAERGTTVVLSSHMLAELELVCDYLIMLTGGRLRLSGDTEEILSAHALVSGAQDTLPGLDSHTVIDSRTTGRQTTALIRPAAPLSPDWTANAPTLEEVVLAYMRNPAAPPMDGGSRDAGLTAGSVRTAA
jgi:ABC-type multidrug transport system ATPase subunit